MSTQYDFIDDSFKLQGETRNLVLSQCLHPFKGFSPGFTRKVQLHAVAAFERIANDTEAHKFCATKPIVWHFSTHVCGSSLHARVVFVFVKHNKYLEM